MPRKRSVKRHQVVQPLDKSYRLIPLTQGQNAIVDTKDFKRLSKYNWFAAWQPRSKGFYAARWSSKKLVFLHHAVVGKKATVDHRNHNTLDCRNKNLRICDNSQNSMNRRMRSDNTSGFKGVSFCKRRHKWHAQIKILGKKKSLGYFKRASHAAKVYDKEAAKLFGEFAFTNF
jgi:hypothetical protein